MYSKSEKSHFVVEYLARLLEVTTDLDQLYDVSVDAYLQAVRRPVRPLSAPGDAGCYEVCLV